MASSVIGDLRVNLGLNSAAFQGGMKDATRQMEGFGAVAQRLTGVLAGVFGAGQLAAMADTYTSISNRLKVLGGDQEQVNQTIEDLNAIAGRTRAPLEATVDLYQRMSIAGSELGASQEQLMRFTENVGLALAQQGGSSGEAAGALFQLSQAMAGGVVRAEEFNSILEGAYPIALAAAKGIERADGSVAKLRKIMLEGKLTSREFFNAILSQTDDLEKAFASTTPTISSALGRLRDNFTVFLGQLDQGAGASASIARAILLLSENLQRVAAYVATAATGFVAYRAAILVSSVATKGLTVSLVALRGALLRTGIGALVVVAGEMVYQFWEAVRVTGNLKAAFYEMKADFLAVIRGMTGAFVDFTWTLAEGFNSLTGTNLSGMSAVATQSLAAMELEARGMASTLTTASTAAANAGKSMGAAGGAIEEAGDKAKGAKEKVSDLQRVMEKLREENDRIKQTAGMTEAQVAAWDAMREAGVNATLQAGQEISRLTAETYGIQQAKDRMDSFKDSVKQTFSDWVTGAGNAADAMKSLVNNIANNLLNSGIDMLFKNLFPQTSANPSGGNWLSGLFTGMFGQKNANGTKNFAGGWTSIHERGEEMAYLPSGSQIIPAGLSKQMAKDKGNANRISVEAVPNPYFDVRVNEISGAGDARMARASAKAAPSLNADNQRRRIRGNA